MSETTPQRNAFAKIYSQLSIRKKLVVLIAGVAGFVTVLAMLLSFFIELNLFKTRLLEEYQATARMTAGNLDAAIIFNDQRDASDVLSVLSVQSYIESAGVYLDDGTVFTSYTNEELELPPSIPPLDVETGFSDGKILIKEPIFDSGVLIAHLVLKASQGELNAFKFAHSTLFVSLLVGAIATAILLAKRLGSHVSRPVIELAETARRITEFQDVSSRQKRISEDETGQLVDAFNEMLEQIEKRSIALVQAKETAEASNRAKDDFLSVISHELRTPLNPIIGYVEILLRNASSENDRKQLSLVKQYAEHLQNLIDRVIDFSRFERGSILVNSEPVNYKRLCQNVLSLLDQQAQTKGLQLLCHHQHSPQELVETNTLRTDRIKLQQIVLNLVSNALKFTESGSITLTTILSKEEGAPHKLRIEVEDTGIGIAPGDRDTVFKPFSQIDSSLTRQYSGMGLGLAITQRIVQVLGGTIDFESETDKGTTFWLEIPVSPTDEIDPDPSIAPSVPEPDPEQEAKILLVDDQLVNLELGESLLTSCGHQVVCARSGADAIKYVQSESFDLIILDIKMPRMNGYETAKEIRKLESDSERTPIIALTAHVTTRGNEQCLEAGMDDLLSKPFNTERLNQITNKWLNRSQTN
ncbi:ATP-binding protein [Pelagicoccus mobilis]|uniref:histidine kinase n=1 Tax=Pelagicoccus mobilis TaxID=415221 RepID=A0A934RVV9_9BACT|nr:ATP-binding protein [Pelagicoccus mobilis]MBK1877772.1 response regulator [Pelagicoccus mobilis]